MLDFISEQNIFINFLILAVYFLLALIMTIYVTPYFIKLALKLKLLDKPGERKIHKYSKPRVGGSAMFFVFFILLLTLGIHRHEVQAIIIGSLLISCIGVLDDIFNIKALVKLLHQVLIAYITSSNLIGFGINIEHLYLMPGIDIQLGYLSVPFTVIWIVGIINAINLIDGLDGLAGGLSSIAAFTLVIVSLIFGNFIAALFFIILLGVLLGFLRYNFNPAKLFMGDAGSMFLGYLIAVVSIISIWNADKVLGFTIPVIVLGIPIYDVLTSILRRLKNRKPIFYPDGEHIHHRIMKIGFSHKQTVIIIYLETMILAVFAILMALLNDKIALISFVTIVFLLHLSVVYIKKKYKEH